MIAAEAWSASAGPAASVVAVVAAAVAGSAIGSSLMTWAAAEAARVSASAAAAVEVVAVAAAAWQVAVVLAWIDVPGQGGPDADRDVGLDAGEQGEAGCSGGQDATDVADGEHGDVAGETGDLDDLGGLDASGVVAVADDAVRAEGAAAKVWGRVGQTGSSTGETACAGGYVEGASADEEARSFAVAERRWRWGREGSGFARGHWEHFH